MVPELETTAAVTMAVDGEAIAVSGSSYYYSSVVTAPVLAVAITMAAAAISDASCKKERGLPVESSFFLTNIVDLPHRLIPVRILTNGVSA